MKQDSVYRQQILDAIGKIERFAAGMSKEDFLSNEMAQSAVIMQLAIIGELSKHLSEEFKSKVDLPWKQIAGFRDRAVHDYYRLELEFVWLTIQDDLPRLQEALSMVEAL